MSSSFPFLVTAEIIEEYRIGAALFISVRVVSQENFSIFGMFASSQRESGAFINDLTSFLTTDDTNCIILFLVPGAAL